MPPTTHQWLQARETSSLVLLGRECKGVAVAVVVVETALPGARRQLRHGCAPGSRRRKRWRIRQDGVPLLGDCGILLLSPCLLAVSLRWTGPW
jgi:hypothetical protein